MEPLEIAAVVLGFILRLSIPVGGTFLFAWFLRKLDARWQAEAEREHRLVLAAAQKAGGKVHCWNYNDCKAHRRQDCPAYINSEKPCWDCFKVNGRLQDSCRYCSFRRQALALAAAAD